MTWEQQRNRVRLVDDDEIVIHPFRLDGTLKHQQILRANDAMLHPGLETKVSAGPEDFDRKRSLVRRTPAEKTCAFADFEALVFLFVHLEREISAFTHDEIILHAEVFMQRDDNPAPPGAIPVIARVLDPIK